MAWITSVENLEMGKTMKSYSDSMIGRLLIFAMMVFLAITLFGCQDPVVRNMDAEHQRLGRICQQEIRQAQLGSSEQGVSAFQAPARTGALYPAP
jgi:hypothetical protein